MADDFQFARDLRDSLNKEGIFRQGIAQNLYRCERAGCDLSFAGGCESARGQGWHIPTIAEQREREKNHHHIPGYVLCDKDWRAALRIGFTL